MHKRLLLFFLLGLVLVTGITYDDVISTLTNEPICIPVTNNDDSGTSITSVSNGTYGTTQLNYPPFWYANSSDFLVIVAENYQIANFNDTSNTYFSSTSQSWVKTAFSGTYDGQCMACLPNIGSNTGNSKFGTSLVYNVMFRRTGTYSTSPRNMPGTSTSLCSMDDSGHYLYQPDLASPVSFLSLGNVAFTSSPCGTWSWSTNAISVNITQSYPVLSRFFLAMREDGIMIDQLAFYMNSTLSSTSPVQDASRFVSCAPNEILYFPPLDFTGADTFSYQGTDGVTWSTSYVSVYVGVPVPSPSPSPSTTSSATPSRSSTPTATVTPTRTSSPTSSRTPSPSVTPSISVSPSMFSSPSVTSSVTPSISITPSASPTASVTSSATPSATPSVTSTPSASVTPSTTPSPSSSQTPSITPSITPSRTPLPLMCNTMPVSVNASNFHTLQPFGSASNFGQTFKPFAPGSLISFAFCRSPSDTGILNGTAYLLQNYVGNPESGFTYQSFPFSLSGAGWQVFNFTPPFRMDLIRYEFLLGAIEGDSPASMMLSDFDLANQYIIQDEEITPSVSAAFQYCMIPDYFPSPSASASSSRTPSPSASPVPSTSPSITPSPSLSSSPSATVAAAQTKSKKSSNVGVIAGSVAGGLLLLFAGGAFLVFLRIRRKNNQPSPSTDLELREHSSSSDTQVYNPIAILTPEHYTTVLIDSEWSIPFSDVKLMKELGRGAFGVVYQGTWKGSSVAVKQAIAFSDHFKQEDFFSEAEVMKKLEPHPNVTRLLGLCSSPFCIVLEFVDNGSLSSWLASDNSMDKQTQVSIALGIAQGMLHLHKAGIVHRDLAARNILLTKDMVPKVSDFGMSRQILEDKTNKTVSDIGPIRWMAPEAMKKKVYSQKTDVWSYGVVLYEILTRNPPYKDLDLVHVATNVTLNELSLVPEIQKEAEEKQYPPVMVRILQGCLSFEPKHRPDFDSIVSDFES